MLNTTLIRNYLDKKLHQYPSIYVEALVLTLIAVILSQILYAKESGIVALFFISILLQQRMQDILDENRKAIFIQHFSGLRANMVTTVKIIFIFVGIFSVFLAITLLFPKELTFNLFKKQLEISQISPYSVVEMPFGSFSPLVQHNIIVLLLVMMFSFFFQHIGAVFVLGLNASIWGVVFSIIGLNTIQQHAFQPILFYMGAALSIFPHLIIEATGYVVGSLSGIFFSKACVKYEIGSDIFNQVAIAAIKMAICSTCLIILSSFIESFFPSVVLSTFFPGLGGKI